LVNDQHAHAGYAAHDGYSTGGFEADPLFGALPGSYEAGRTDQAGPYDPAWETSPPPLTGYGTYAAPEYDTGGRWTTLDAPSATGYPPPAAPPGRTEQFESAQFTNPEYESAPYGYEPTAQFDASQFRTTPYGYEPATQWPAPAFDTGAYDATVWNAVQETVLVEALAPDQLAPEPAVEHTTPYEPAAEYEDPEAGDGPGPRYGSQGRYDPEEQPGQGQPGSEAAYTQETGHSYDDESGDDTQPRPVPDHLAMTQTGPVAAATPHPVRPPGGNGNGNRGRRRTPARRSALLTVAVPSACVMGVAGIAAASVGGLAGGDEKQDDKTSQAAADPGAVKPAVANNAMDTQLAALSADARDFGDRASRTQERIDLKARQEAEKQKRVDDAARKEALRPKFVLPVTQRGLSAYFGQAGVNWMSVHTGIDFPVSYGTPVVSATDGTVRTQWNSAYGNMAIVTSPDGTETWYCHLSSTKIRSGSVKAGEVIAYSGNSGNSTGPHLHFEVRPGAGSAIDPLPWLRDHGLDPT
jgi:murein DD-endopeptidase MepM/ murein hydrolase activator NlpD